MIIADALNLTEVTAPTEEPISLAIAKAHLRIDGSDSDTWINAAIETARRYVEGYTGRAMIARTNRIDLRHWDSDVRIPKPPLISVDSVKYYDTTNTQQTWASTNYEVDKVGGRILLAYGKSIPSSYDRFDSWQVTYQCGYESTSSPLVLYENVPEGLKSAMLLFIGTLYEYRETMTPLETWELKTINRLLDMYKTR